MQVRKETGETGYIPETYVQTQQRNHQQPLESTSSERSELSIYGTQQSQHDDNEVKAAMGADDTAVSERAVRK